MVERFRARAAAVRSRGLPPIEGPERKRFAEQAQLDFMDYAMLGDAEAFARGRDPDPARRPPPRPRRSSRGPAGRDPRADRMTHGVRLGRSTSVVHPGVLPSAGPPSRCPCPTAGVCAAVDHLSHEPTVAAQGQDVAHLAVQPRQGTVEDRCTGARHVHGLPLHGRRRRASSTTDSVTGLANRRTTARCDRGSRLRANTRPLSSSSWVTAPDSTPMPTSFGLMATWVAQLIVMRLRRSVGTGAHHVEPARHGPQHPASQPVVGRRGPFPPAPDRPPHGSALMTTAGPWRRCASMRASAFT